MGGAKTVPTDRPVAEFLGSVADDGRRADALALCRTLQALTGEPTVMWGASIVGFGSQHYRYASGREGDWPRVGFSPRKQGLTLYLSSRLDQHQDLLARLGKHKTGVGCVSLKRLSDADPEVLAELVRRSLEDPAADGAGGSAPDCAPAGGHKGLPPANTD